MSKMQVSLSKRLEDQVVEQVQDDMSIEQDATFWFDQSCLMMNKSSDFLERTEDNEHDELYLPFPSFDLFWV